MPGGVVASLNHPSNGAAPFTQKQVPKTARQFLSLILRAAKAALDLGHACRGGGPAFVGKTMRFEWISIFQGHMALWWVSTPEGRKRPRRPDPGGDPRTVMAPPTIPPTPTCSRDGPI